MSDIAAALTRRAATLRLAFGSGFAEPVRRAAGAAVDLLAIRAGAEAYALRLSEIAGLFADRKITSVPGSDPALLGIAGFRGAIVPVLRLATLLGHSAAGTPRWLVIAAAEPVALAFESFEAQLRIPRDAILPAAPRGETRSFAQEFLRSAEFVGPILHLPSVLGSRSGGSADTKER
jgi:chemotaxis signal transduction protein